MSGSGFGGGFDGDGPRAVSFPPGANEDTPMFVISVAAQLSGLHAQTLRTYDRLGLVVPGLTGIAPQLTSAAAVGLGIIQALALRFHISRHEPRNATCPLGDFGRQQTTQAVTHDKDLARVDLGAAREQPYCGHCVDEYLFFDR